MTLFKPDLERAVRGAWPILSKWLYNTRVERRSTQDVTTEVVRAALLAWYSRTPLPEEVEAMAIALSLADPDERGLPEGERMAPFYRKLVRAVYEAQARFMRQELES